MVLAWTACCWITRSCVSRSGKWKSVDCWHTAAKSVSKYNSPSLTSVWKYQTVGCSHIHTWTQVLATCTQKTNSTSTTDVSVIHALILVRKYFCLYSKLCLEKVLYQSWGVIVVFMAMLRVLYSLRKALYYNYRRISHNYTCTQVFLSVFIHVIRKKSSQLQVCSARLTR